jgi:hypothetical protein
MRSTELVPQAEMGKEQVGRVGKAIFDHMERHCAEIEWSSPIRRVGARKIEMEIEVEI